jgi:hypothetical protein
VDRGGAAERGGDPLPESGCSPFTALTIIKA